MKRTDDGILVAFINNGRLPRRSAPPKEHPIFRRKMGFLFFSYICPFWSGELAMTPGFMGRAVASGDSLRLAVIGGTTWQSSDFK